MSAPKPCRTCGHSQANHWSRGKCSQCTCPVYVPPPKRKETKP